MICKATFVATAYSDTTGTQVWGPITLPNANNYDADTLAGMVANGTLYVTGLGGDVWAINMLTGAVLWHYNTGSAGLDTPYGVWPIWTQGNSWLIGGGILVFSEGHSYSPPLFRGY